MCEDYDDDASGCFVIGKYFNDVVVNMSKEEGFDISKASIKTVNSELWKALVEIQDTWFGQSDALVTEYSQKFVDQNLRLSPENIAAFTKPRRFVFHDAMAPWEDILHGPFSSAELNINIAGATMQGLDIVCALDLHCCPNVLSLTENDYLKKLHVQPCFLHF